MHYTWGGGRVYLSGVAVWAGDAPPRNSVFGQLVPASAWLLRRTFQRAGIDFQVHIFCFGIRQLRGLLGSTHPVCEVDLYSSPKEKRKYIWVDE